MALQPLMGLLPQRRFGFGCNHSHCAPPRWSIVTRWKPINNYETAGTRWMVGRYLSRHFLIKGLLIVSRNWNEPPIVSRWS